MAEAKNAWEALGLDQTSYDYLQAIYENLAAADAAKTDALAPYDQVPGGREAALANLLAELRRVGAGDPDDLSMIGTFDRVGTRNSLLNKALDLDAVDKHVRKGSTVTPPDLTPDLPAPENDATALDEGHRALLEEIGFDPTDNALAALRGVLGDMLLEAGSLSSDLEAGDTFDDRGMDRAEFLERVAREKAEALAATKSTARDATAKEPAIVADDDADDKGTTPPPAPKKADKKKGPGLGSQLMGYAGWALGGMWSTATAVVQSAIDKTMGTQEERQDATRLFKRTWAMANLEIDENGELAPSDEAVAVMKKRDAARAKDGLEPKYLICTNPEEKIEKKRNYIYTKDAEAAMKILEKRQLTQFGDALDTLVAHVDQEIYRVRVGRKPLFPGAPEGEVLSDMQYIELALANPKVREQLDDVLYRIGNDTINENERKAFLKMALESDLGPAITVDSTIRDMRNAIIRLDNKKREKNGDGITDDQVEHEIRKLSELNDSRTVAATVEEEEVAPPKKTPKIVPPKKSAAVAYDAGERAFVREAGSGDIVPSPKAALALTDMLKRLYPDAEVTPGMVKTLVGDYERSVDNTDGMTDDKKLKLQLRNMLSALSKAENRGKYEVRLGLVEAEAVADTPAYNADGKVRQAFLAALKERLGRDGDEPSNDLVELAARKMHANVKELGVEGTITIGDMLDLAINRHHIDAARAELAGAATEVTDPASSPDNRTILLKPKFVREVPRETESEFELTLNDLVPTEEAKAAVKASLEKRYGAANVTDDHVETVAGKLASMLEKAIGETKLEEMTVDKAVNILENEKNAPYFDRQTGLKPLVPDVSTEKGGGRGIGGSDGARRRMGGSGGG